MVKRILTTLAITAAFGALQLWTSPVHAQSPTASGGSSLSRNPNGVQNRVESIAQPKDALFRVPALEALLDPYYRFKQNLKDRYGLAFGMFYSPMAQFATTGAIPQGFGGTFNLDVNWNLLGRGTDHPGHLLFRMQHRHRYTSVSPTTLFLQTGSMWPSTIGYGPFKLSVLELAWQQHIIKDRFIVRAGKMIPFSNHDYFRFKSPFAGFNDANFTLNPTIAYNSTGLGIAALVRPREDIYITAGLYDANGKPQRTGFNTFFNTREYLKIVDVGWDPGHLNKDQEVHLGPVKVSDVHLTFWHKDRLKAAGAPAGWGVSFLAEGEIGRYVPFIRAGYSNGKAGGPSLLNVMLAGGVGIRAPFGQKNDLIGLAAAWGQRDLGTIDTNGDNIPDLAIGNVNQFSAEAFYRLQVIKEFSITPHVQVIVNPALNAGKNFVAVFGLRGRWAM